MRPVPERTHSVVTPSPSITKTPKGAQLVSTANPTIYIYLLRATRGRPRPQMGQNSINYPKGGRAFPPARTRLSRSKRQSYIQHSKSQPTTVSVQGLGKKDKWAVRLESLSSRLVRRDAIKCFASNCEKIWGDWTSLLRKTALPPHVASSDTRVIAAFRAVDDVISAKQSTYVLRWLAYMRLTALFDHLKPVVKSESVSNETSLEIAEAEGWALYYTCLGSSYLGRLLGHRASTPIAVLAEGQVRGPNRRQMDISSHVQGRGDRPAQGYRVEKGVAVGEHLSEADILHNSYRL